MISEPVSVKSIDYVGETPFCRVEDRIDRESEDNDILVMIERIVDKEEHNRDGISVYVNHRYGDKHIRFPKNITNCKHIPLPSVHWLVSL